VISNSEKKNQDFLKSYYAMNRSRAAMVGNNAPGAPATGPNPVASGPSASVTSPQPLRVRLSELGGFESTSDGFWFG